MAEEMKEGFLCPICMADLGDVIQLQVLKKNKIPGSKYNIYAKWPCEKVLEEKPFLIILKCLQEKGSPLFVNIVRFQLFF